MEKPTNSKNIWSSIKKVKRIVVKIGTNALLLPSGDFDYMVFARITRELKQLMEQGKEVILVSSGAVSAGMGRLKIKSRPIDLVKQQVLAAVGNPYLFREYAKYFDNTAIAQVLLTQENLSERKSYLHVKNTLETALKMKIIPIINENDVVSIDELAGFKTGTDTTYNFSDNDVLSALIAGSIGADLLIILSDVEGLYDKLPSKPGACLIPTVEDIDEEIKKIGKRGSSTGRGGMKTKIKAAEIATKSGAYVILAHAKKHSIIEIITKGKIGTVFCPSQSLPSRELWLVYAANVGGSCIVDKGAKKAITNGASLLFPGILKLDGDFNKGDVIQILNEDGKEFAKGVVNFSASEIKKFLKYTKKPEYSILKNILNEVISHNNICLVEKI
ncbi:MAG: glutamate 5-kinase [Candidatus Ranarchaeia archaeon]